MLGIDGDLSRSDLNGRLLAALLLLGQRGAEANLVDGEAVVLRDIARQVEREAVGVPQEEGILAGDLGAALLAHLGHEVVEDAQAVDQRAVKALLFLGDGLEDVGALGDQVRVVQPHLVDDGVGHQRQEGTVEAEQLAEARRAAQDHAQHVLAALVARQHAVTDQESAGARVVGDGAVAIEILLALCVALPGQLLDAVHDRHERIGVVVVVLTLEDTGEALQPAAGVYARRGQRHERAVGLGVILHKDQVPDLQVLVVFVHAVGNLHGQVAPVVVNLGAGAAGTGVAHGPPVILLAKAQHA